MVSRLWDRFMVSDWRERARARSQRPEMSKEEQAKLIRELDRMEAEAEPTEPFDSEDAEQVVIKRSIPVQRGKWRLLPPEVEEDNKQGK